MSKTDSAQSAAAVGSSDQQSRSDRLKLVLALIPRPQTAVADKLDVTPPYLSQLKHHRRPISKSLAFKLERVLGISAAWVLRGQGPMISDLEKARQFIDFEQVTRSSHDPTLLEVTFRDLEGELHTERAQRILRDYPSSTGGEQWVEVPVLDMPVADRPEASPHFRGLSVKLPCPDALELYCLEAGPYGAAGFRQGDYLLVERRPSSQWHSDEVDGKVCVARRSGQETWQLLELRLVEGVPPAQVRMRSLSGSPQFGEALWEDLEIAGVVRMSFRTQLSRAVPWVQQTDLFADGAADLDDA